MTEQIETLNRAMAKRIAELDAKITILCGALQECRDQIDGYIWNEYPGDHHDTVRRRKRDLQSNPARIALAKLTGGAE